MHTDLHSGSEIRRQPSVVDLQLLRIGNLIIACVPGEFTTMSGRRLREAVSNEFHSAGGLDVEVVIAGLTNTYSSYITTFEEYQEQRYEGASTLYGPHTLQAYIQVRTVSSDRSYCSACVLSYCRIIDLWMSMCSAVHRYHAG